MYIYIEKALRFHAKQAASVFPANVRPRNLRNEQRVSFETPRDYAVCNQEGEAGRSATRSIHDSDRSLHGERKVASR